MTARAWDWAGGCVKSHADLDIADQAFWDDAGPTARFEASADWTCRGAARARENTG